MDDSTKDLTSSERFLSRLYPSRAEPSRAEPSRAEPSRAEALNACRAQSRGLRAPCERFAPGVTPGPRIHSVPAGGRPWPDGIGYPQGFEQGFEDHITASCPLDRLSRHTRWCTNRHGPARCSPTGSSPADAIRHGSAESGHPIEDLTAEDDFTPLPGWAPGAKTSSDDGRVAKNVFSTRP